MQIRLKSQALFASLHAVEFPTLRCANHTVNNDLSRLANGLWSHGEVKMISDVHFSYENGAAAGSEAGKINFYLKPVLEITAHLYEHRSGLEINEQTAWAMSK